MPNRLKIEKVIQDFNNQHNYFYFYDKVEYINAKTEVIIICPIHGDFLQTPDSHKRGSGCPKCAKLKIIERHRKNLSHKNEGFIKKSIIKHGDYFDYSKVDYKNCKIKVTIICPKHGEFKIIPEKHYNDGIGCKDCSVSSKGELKITNILNKNKLQFTKQKYHNYLGIKMFFDFYLDNYDIYIEFDGKQHFQDNCFRNKNTQHNQDIFKNNFICIKNKTLIRIHFLDINKMEKIILDILNNKEKRNNIYYSRNNYYQNFQ